MARPLIHRDALIEQGLALFYARGFNAVGINEILSATGAPKGSFYHQFPDKGSFAIAVLELYFERHIRFMHRFIRADSKTPKQDILKYYDAMTKQFKKNGFAQGCLLGNMTVELADIDSNSQQRLKEMFGSWTNELAEAIRSAQARGQIKTNADATGLARFTISSWEGALLASRAARSDEPLKAFREFVFNQVLS
jgi:TetR/AcrR family transcriptional regulator, transcriptional repressor for nem operon